MAPCSRLAAGKMGTVSPKVCSKIGTSSIRDEDWIHETLCSKWSLTYVVNFLEFVPMVVCKSDGIVGKTAILMTVFEKISGRYRTQVP